MRRFAMAGAIALALFAASAGGPARAQMAPSAGPQPAPYAVFIKGAKVEPGLIPLIRKAGMYYFVLSPKQIGRSFVETSVPSTGLGGFGPAAGEPYVAPARIFEFDRADGKIALRWPNRIAQTVPGTPQALAAKQSMPSSVIAVVPIVARDAATGNIVIPAAPFLGDVANYYAVFSQTIHNPMHGYHLDPSRTFFSTAKAFLKNDVLHVRQTWASFDPNLIDNAPDARSIEVGMTYNILKEPNDGFVPRIYDPRVGFFSIPRLNFASDDHETRNVNYILRWNFKPATPGKPSLATHPLVFSIGNDVPVAYRATIRKALLTWNDAFQKIGILDAVKVRQLPANADPENLSYNVVRWVDTTQPQYGAEALIIGDPRTGEELNVGINVDAVEGTAGRAYRFLIAPARGLPDSAAAEKKFVLEAIRSTVLHESGHDFGLQHNFISAMAYTAKDLQSKAFTEKYGISTSVMAYNPINLWPKGTPQGDYEQLVLGPYDYHAIQYGYGYIGATTPEAELPTLDRWAAQWANPYDRFASDEDVDFASGHAIDPRVFQFMLTDHPLHWCEGQVGMMRGLMNALLARFPSPGHAYDEARLAFTYPFTDDLRCSLMAAHTIGGEDLSRSRRTDPHATLPLTAVPRKEEIRAWNLLASELFDNNAWHFNADVLRSLTYSEVSSFTNGAWAYNPTPRHDVPVVETVNAVQNAALNEVFAPLTLQRIADIHTKYRANSTMSLSDLFTWSQATIFGDLANGLVAHDGVIKRNLQVAFAKRLATMWLHPMPGTPSDAQALARAELVNLRNATSTGLGRKGLDEITRAHLEALRALANAALRGHVEVGGAPTMFR